MTAAARACGASCELIEIPRGGHGEWLALVSRPKDGSAPAWWTRMFQFLDTHLEVVRPSGPASVPTGDSKSTTPSPPQKPDSPEK
jgi:hypothetical protein